MECEVRDGERKYNPTSKGRVGGAIIGREAFSTKANWFQAVKRGEKSSGLAGRVGTFNRIKGAGKGGLLGGSQQFMCERGGGLSISKELFRRNSATREKIVCLDGAKKKRG